MSDKASPEQSLIGELASLRTVLNCEGGESRPNMPSMEDSPETMDPVQDSDCLDIPILTDHCEPAGQADPEQVAEETRSPHRLAQPQAVFAADITTEHVEQLVNQLVAEQLPKLEQLLREKLLAEIERHTATPPGPTAQHSIDEN